MLEEITIKMYKTSDGRPFENKMAAEIWEGVLEQRIEFNEKYGIRPLANFSGVPLSWFNIKDVEQTRTELLTRFTFIDGAEFMVEGNNVATMMGDQIIFYDMTLVKQMQIDLFTELDERN